MLQATLTRDNSGGTDGTFGVLRIGTSFSVLTVEDDREGNARRRSCIPPGTYRCVRTIYRKHGIEVFEVTGVDGRTRILIHIANHEGHVEGCIGVGLRVGTLMVVDEDAPAHQPHRWEHPILDTCRCPKVPKRAVLESGRAFRRLMDFLQGEDAFTLTIMDPFWPAAA